MEETPNNPSQPPKPSAPPQSELNSAGQARRPVFRAPRPGDSHFQPGRPAPKAPLVRPRKVRGGVKIPAGDVAGPMAWAAQRWLRLLEQAGEGESLVEGLEYARAGQTKRMTVMQGKIDASIQGRSDRPYSTFLTFKTFNEEQWDAVVKSMAEGAIYAAKLLAGELPPNIEDVFVPLGLKLFPTEPAEVGFSCNCPDMRGEPAVGFAAPLPPAAVDVDAEGDAEAALAGAVTPAAVPAGPKLRPGMWCKHCCCVGYLLANRLAAEPFLMFALRGMEAQDLLERVRQRRVVAGAVTGSTAVYTQRVPGVSDIPSRSLESNLEGFWNAGAELDALDLPLTPPAVSHPLLRRLGPSPFTGAAFPLVGLLASCYEAISLQAQQEAAMPVPGERNEPVDEDEVDAEE